MILPAPAEPVPPLDETETSLLQSVMENIERQTGLHMSFDDMTGYQTGFHRDIPAMDLDWAHQLHSCDFCQFAGGSPVRTKDCVVNKLACNRIVVRQRRRLEGLCHLGIFEMAEPLVFQGTVLGIFYFGSVLVKGREAASRKKVRRHCARRGLDPASYLEALARVPVIDPATIPAHRESLRVVVKLAHHFCETAGLRAETYRRRKLRFPYTDPEKLPVVVAEALRYITANLSETFIVKDIAQHVRCHPDFLSRKFKQHTGIDLSLYIQNARIERAKQLLQQPHMDIGQAADLAGFSDRVHFSKVFRRVTGVTPGTFHRQFAGE